MSSLTVALNNLTGEEQGQQVVLQRIKRLKNVKLDFSNSKEYFSLTYLLREKKDSFQYWRNPLFRKGVATDFLSRFCPSSSSSPASSSFPILSLSRLSLGGGLATGFLLLLLLSPSLIKSGVKPTTLCILPLYTQSVLLARLHKVENTRRCEN